MKKVCMLLMVVCIGMLTGCQSITQMFQENDISAYELGRIGAKGYFFVEDRLDEKKVKAFQQAYHSLDVIVKNSGEESNEVLKDKLKAELKRQIKDKKILLATYEVVDLFWGRLDRRLNINKKTYAEQLGLLIEFHRGVKSVVDVVN